MIPYGHQSINNSDIQAVLDALKSDLLTTGPLVEEFEKVLQENVGAPAIAVSSGTAALHCAYAAIGIEEGDEIITPPITFIATQATAALLGAKIIFVDVEADTANINPDLVEAKITSKTKAIVAVDYAGHPADMFALRKIADKHDVFLIEDAAHSLGSIYNGRKVGSLADLTTFSFFPTKNITTGEGGAVSSTNSVLLDRARKFSRQGLIRDQAKFTLESHGAWHQEVHQFGLNYRLPDVLCALGISQISRLDEMKRRRREIFAKYVSGLAELGWVQLPVEKNNVITNWHLFPIRVPQRFRSEIFDNLRSCGIGVQVNYIPAYRHPVFKSQNINPADYPNSEQFYSEEISLPMYVDLSDEDLEKVIQTLKSMDYSQMK